MLQKKKKTFVLKRRCPVNLSEPTVTSIPGFVLRLLCEGNAVFMVPSLAFLLITWSKSTEEEVKVGVR